MIGAYNNSVCIFVKCDGFEFPVTPDEAQKLIEELQFSIKSLTSTKNEKDTE